MTRWILCRAYRTKAEPSRQVEGCAATFQKRYPRLTQVNVVTGMRYEGRLFDASLDGPGESGTMQSGAARHDMVCDHCNRTLEAGTRVWAVGVVPDGQVPPTGWESEFVVDEMVAP